MLATISRAASSYPVHCHLDLSTNSFEILRDFVMRSFTCEYLFDELAINLCDRTETGLLLYGRAELTAAGEDYEGEFYVSAIQLDGGSRLTRSSMSHSGDIFESELFRRIAVVIEDEGMPAGRHAAEFFAAEFNEFKARHCDMQGDARQDRVLEASV